MRTRKITFAILKRELENFALSNNGEYIETIALMEEMNKTLKNEKVELRNDDKISIIKSMNKIRVRARREGNISINNKLDNLHDRIIEKI